MYFMKYPMEWRKGIALAASFGSEFRPSEGQYNKEKLRNKMFEACKAIPFAMQWTSESSVQLK